MATAFSYPQLKAALWARPDARVHAVVDAGLVPGLPTQLETAEVNGWDCLRRGAMAPEAAERAPYLVDLKDTSAFTDWLLQEATTTYPGWGLLLVSNRALLPVREHCRKLGDVITPEGERRAWRWWDPELLQLLLPSFSASQLDEVFALEQAVVLPAAAGWSWHALEQGVLAATLRPLEAAAK